MVDRCPVDEDADLRASLAALGLDALRQLQDVLTWPQTFQSARSRLVDREPPHSRIRRCVLLRKMRRQRFCGGRIVRMATLSQLLATLDSEQRSVLTAGSVDGATGWDGSGLLSSRPDT